MAKRKKIGLKYRNTEISREKTTIYFTKACPRG